MYKFTLIDYGSSISGYTIVTHKVREAYNSVSFTPGTEFELPRDCSGRLAVLLHSCNGIYMNMMDTEIPLLNMILDMVPPMCCMDLNIPAHTQPDNVATAISLLFNHGIQCAGIKFHNYEHNNNMSERCNTTNLQDDVFLFSERVFELQDITQRLYG